MLVLIVGYGSLRDEIVSEITLKAMQKPAITVETLLINAQSNEVKLIVNNETKIIEETDPTILHIQVIITNNGSTPINTLLINETLPNDWRWTQEALATITRKNITMFIPETHYNINYDVETHSLTITMLDIESAIGFKLNQNDTVSVFFKIEYSLTGKMLPPEYEASPPSYAMNSSTIGMTKIDWWKSDLTCNFLSFTTYIYLV